MSWLTAARSSPCDALQLLRGYIAHADSSRYHDRMELRRPACRRASGRCLPQHGGGYPRQWTEFGELLVQRRGHAGHSHKAVPATAGKPTFHGLHGAGDPGMTERPRLRYSCGWLGSFIGSLSGRRPAVDNRIVAPKPPDPERQSGFPLRIMPKSLVVCGGVSDARSFPDHRRRAGHQRGASSSISVWPGWTMAGPAVQPRAGSPRCTCGKPKAVAAKAFTMN